MGQRMGAERMPIVMLQAQRVVEGMAQFSLDPSSSGRGRRCRRPVQMSVLP